MDGGKLKKFGIKKGDKYVWEVDQIKKMKRLLLTPIFKSFNKNVFFSSLNQNSCPVYDALEIKTTRTTRSY